MRRRWPLLALLVALLAGLALWWLGDTGPAVIEPDPRLEEAKVRIRERDQDPVPEGEAPDGGPVECTMWRTIGDTAELALLEVDPKTLEAIGWLYPERLVGAMRFEPRHDVGLGWLHLTGHEPGVVSWAAGSCLDFVELEEQPTFRVSGRLVGVVETGAVSVAARCDDAFAGFSSPQPPEALFDVALPADAESCVLKVRRVFGGRDLYADYPVPVRDQEGLELGVPTAPGVGLGVTEVETGLRVYGIERDSPAEEAGLEILDLVLEVDGEPAAELDADELVLDEGPLTLLVEREGERFEVTVSAR